MENEEGAFYDFCGCEVTGLSFESQTSLCLRVKIIVTVIHEY